MCTWILIIGLIILVGNSTISILLSKKFLLKAHFIVLHYQNCAINKHHSCPVFSASCVHFSGQPGTSMLSISGFNEPRSAQVAHSTTWNRHNDEDWDPNRSSLHWCWFQCLLDPEIRMRHTYVNEMPAHRTECCVHGHTEAELFK